LPTACRWSLGGGREPNSTARPTAGAAVAGEEPIEFAEVYAVAGMENAARLRIRHIQRVAVANGGNALPFNEHIGIVDVDELRHDYTASGPMCLIPSGSFSPTAISGCHLTFFISHSPLSRLYRELTKHFHSSSLMSL